MMRVLGIVAVVAVLAAAAPAVAAPVQLAQWTFETSIPTTAGPHSAENGFYAGATSPALGSHVSTATVYDNPTGNGTPESFSSNNWAVGDYYQFSTSTIGYAGITIEWEQTSSNTGPRDFILQYSANGTSFTPFGAAWVVPANAAPLGPWSGTTYKTGFHFGFDLSSVTSLDNKAAVYFRLVDNSTVSANGGTVAAGGTDRVDTVTIVGLTPEPASLVLLAVGGLMLIRRR
jgi:hypothetical protein